MNEDSVLRIPHELGPVPPKGPSEEPEETK
jgi:hypothetical protein